MQTPSTSEPKAEVPCCNCRVEAAQNPEAIIPLCETCHTLQKLNRMGYGTSRRECCSSAHLH